MFRKAEWFQAHMIGWGISPRTWQGWVWCLTWAFALNLPVLAILTGNWIVGGLVFTLMLGYLIYDVSRILGEIRPSQET